MDELPYYTAITQTGMEAQAYSHVTFAASSARWLRAPSERETSHHLAGKINMHFSVADLLKWRTMECGDHWILSGSWESWLRAEHWAVHDVTNLKTCTLKTHTHDLPAKWNNPN